MTTPKVTWPRPAGPLTLRPPTREAIDDILAWRNRPEVTRWLLRTTVDPDAFRAAWLGAVDDPRDPSTDTRTGSSPRSGGPGADRLLASPSVTVPAE